MTTTKSEGFLKSMLTSRKSHKQKASSSDQEEEEEMAAQNDQEEASEKSEATPKDAEAETNKEGFLKSLWNRKSQKKDTKESEEEEIASRHAAVEAENSDTTPNDAGEEEDDAEPPKKSRWQLWGSKKAADEEEEEEAIGVEVDSSLQIHDNTRNFCLRDTVHEEALEMLTGSLLIYIFADLRQMAREGVIESEDLMQDPISIGQVGAAIHKHREALAERAINHEDITQRLASLKDIHDQQQPPPQGNEETVMVGQVLQGGPQADAIIQAAQGSNIQQSVLAHFHDETSTQGVVYGIAVNHLRKRVTILFRGSVTQQDFITDSRSAQKKIDNPVLSLMGDEESANASKQIQVHTGFYHYLFRKDKDEDKTRRLEHILAAAKRLLKENPGYRLYCTGHSLGGALSTLCGFYAAMEDEMVKNGPVVVISIASPQVGHSNFGEAFHSLERMGRLQHLRIANREDMITHLPFMHIKAHAFSPLFSAIYGAGNLYKHCGIQLELKSVEEEQEKQSQHFRVHHPKSRCADKESYSEEFKRTIDAAKLLAAAIVPLKRGDFEALTSFHSCKEYEARLMACQEYLSSVTLDQLYQDEAIVGGALARHLSESTLQVVEAQ